MVSYHSRWAKPDWMGARFKPCFAQQDSRPHAIAKALETAIPTFLRLAS
jgi:hypothetical protein